MFSNRFLFTLLFGCLKDPNDLVHSINTLLSSSIALHITIQENKMALLSATKFSKK